MDSNNNDVILFITYNKGYAEVEIEVDGVRTKYDAKYRNVDNKDQRVFCSEVANRIEKEIGVSVRWIMDEPKSQQKKSDKGQRPTTIIVIAIVMIVLTVILGYVISTIKSTAHTASVASIVNERKSHADIDDILMSQDLSNEYNIDASFSIRYPIEWKTQNATDGRYFYPNYGGLLYVFKNDLETNVKKENAREVFGQYIEGMQERKNDGFEFNLTNGSIKSANIDVGTNASAFSCEFTLKNSDGEYRGTFVAIIKDSSLYGTMMAVPSDEYDTYSSHIKKILNTIKYIPSADDASSGDTTSSIASYATEPANLFELSNGQWYSNSLYTICEGTVSNVSNRTYKFIKVKGMFKDTENNVIDTATTYACGDEGLAPGESTTFRLSVNRNDSIASVSYAVYEYE